MKTITDQKEILKALTEGAKPAPIPEKTETTLEVVIPTWQSIANTYSEAVQKALDAIKATRPFYNWRESQIDEKYLKESKEKIKAFKKLPVEDNFITLKVQMGSKYKGKSVEEVRKLIAKNGEILLGAYEVACIVLTHPEILQKYEDLWIGCPGDEFSPDDDGVFSWAPYFDFSGGKVGFDAKGVSRASVYCGSASGLSPQVNL